MAKAKMSRLGMVKFSSYGEKKSTENLPKLGSENVFPKK